MTSPEASRAHYEANRQQVKDAARLSYERKKAWVAALKEASPCVDCGVSYPARVMHYHHVDPSTKAHGISHLARNAGRRRILDEIAKCVLLCANCHALRHNE